MNAADAKIADIQVGPRIRRQFGDLRALADSIHEIGLLQPIVLTPGLALIAGERRLRACRDILGWETIPARIVDLDDLLIGEHNENEIRDGFTPTERVALKRAIEARIGERRGGDRTGKGGKFPQWSEIPAGIKTADYAAEKAGLGDRKTAAAAEFVVDTAVPELIEVMDAGLVAPSQAAKIAKRPKKQQQRIAEKITDGVKPTEAVRRTISEEIAQHKPEFPTGKYRVIYADPPWSYGNTQPDYHPEQRDHYAVMSLADICSLPVREISERDAVLFLWVTSPILEEAFDVIRAWGFTYKASFVWDKVKHNMGHYNSVRHELLLVCTRGACMPDVKKLFDSVVTEERTAHSRKPEVFYDIIETLYPHGARVELFARGAPRRGWSVFGNQADAAA